MNKRKRRHRPLHPKPIKLTKNGEIDLRSVGNGSGLSPKHRRVIRNYIDPNSPTEGNATQSAIAAGYSPISARDTGSKILQRPDTEKELNRIFDAAGLTTQKLAKRVRQAVDATEARPFLHQATGNVVYAKKIAAHDTRLKAIRLAAELRGDFAPKEVDVRVAVLAGRLEAARRREIERTPPQPVVVGPDDKESEPLTPTESTKVASEN